MITLKEIEIQYKRKEKFSAADKVQNIEAAVKILRPYFENHIDYKELFYCVYLNRAMSVLSVMKISEGGTGSTVVDIKMVLQGALLENASAIILAHNHPSGQLKPSQADIKITEQIKKAAQIFDIEVVDHIILTNESFNSIIDL